MIRVVTPTAVIKQLAKGLDIYAPASNNSEAIVEQVVAAGLGFTNN